MTHNSWRQRSAAIRRSAEAEGFDIARLVHVASVGDPHGHHVGVRFNAMIPSQRVSGRVEDVALPLSRGAWSPPTELCEAHSVARRKLLSDLVHLSGRPDAQMAVLAAAFVHSHVMTENRRRHSWPIPLSEGLVDVAMDHLKSVDVDMVLPSKGAYVLLATNQMCRAAPEPYCTDQNSLDQSVGRHLALSFRDKTILSISIGEGGQVAPVPKTGDVHSLLALDRTEFERMVMTSGLDEMCRIYGMKMRDMTMACRRRGIDPARMAA